MENWKKAVIFGGIGAGAVLFASGRRPAGMILAGIGAAMLASEYPERLQQLWERAPEYMDRGNELMAAISRIAQQGFGDAHRQRGFTLSRDDGRTLILCKGARPRAHAFGWSRPSGRHDRHLLDSSFR